MSQTTPLTGQTALVTGATAGIGRAIATHLAELGATVVVHGRDVTRAASVVDEIIHSGGQARAVVADLTDAADTVRLAADAGEVDILVNNAGIYSFLPVAQTSAEVIDEHFAVNVRAPFLLVGALAPAMATRGHGSVINITSGAATTPNPFGSVYGATKAAMEIATRSWATEFASAGVRVNAVSPGPVRTPGTEALLGDHLDAPGNVNLRGTIGAPQEIADVVGFLATDAASYVIGAIIPVDGGAPVAMAM